MSTPLNDGAEVLLRQIHPDFIDAGVPSSTRFHPTQSDHNLLSVDRGSVVDAATSHANYTSSGLLSAAIFGLTVSEFSGETIPCVEDPIPAGEGGAGNAAHALADYSAHDPKSQKLIAKRLKRLAVARGQLHP